MWLESSSINAVNLAKKSATIPEIPNFSYGIIFFGARCTPCPEKRGHSILGITLTNVDEFL